MSLFRLKNVVLLNAVLENDAECVSDLLKSGSDPNQTWPDGMTGLHVAAQRGLLTMAQVLLDHKADINIRDISGYTPVFHAVYTNNVENATLSETPRCRHEHC